jgi:hypothetical protein
MSNEKTGSAASASRVLQPECQKEFCRAQNREDWFPWRNGIGR